MLRHPKTHLAYRPPLQSTPPSTSSPKHQHIIAMNFLHALSLVLISVTLLTVRATPVPVAEPEPIPARTPEYYNVSLPLTILPPSSTTSTPFSNYVTPRACRSDVPQSLGSAVGHGLSSGDGLAVDGYVHVAANIHDLKHVKQQKTHHEFGVVGKKKHH